MHSKSNLQSNIFIQISHELRIPLTGILGMVHFLNKTPLNKQQKKFLKHLSKSAQQLLGAEAKIHAILKNHNTN